MGPGIIGGEGRTLGEGVVDELARRMVGWSGGSREAVVVRERVERHCWEAGLVRPCDLENPTNLCAGTRFADGCISTWFSR